MGRLTDAREKLLRWREQPVAFVRECLHAEPDAWQADVLTHFHDLNRIAMKACKGPGKTAVLAWLIILFLLTNRDSRIAATSITGDNLSQNLWPEINLWMNRAGHVVTDYFAWTKTQVVSKEYPGTWWAQARAWPKSGSPDAQADALAGLHAEAAMAVLDECGGIPQGVMATAEAVLATGGYTKVVIAGNPTHTTGPLYRACTTDRKLWHVVTITGDPDDPNRSPRINIEHARQQIEQYGRDNPWVMVNILGEFPPSSIDQLLSADQVDKAMHRKLRQDAYEWAQKRLGVDVARFGDDRTVIFPRQGLASFKPDIMRNARTTRIAATVARHAVTWGAERIYVDDSGHWGHGVIDNLIDGGYDATPVLGEDPATNPRYSNHRSEMYMNLAEWVKRGGMLPNLPEMVKELTDQTYTFIGGKFVLESKKQIKERLGWSPDLADALAYTFAEIDMPSDMRDKLGRPAGAAGIVRDRGFGGKVLRDDDPYKWED